MSRKRKAAEEPAIDNGQVLKLRKLDPSSLRDSCLVCLVAMKGGGKTTLLKDLIDKKKHFPAGVVFSASGEANGEYDHIFPKMYMYDTCNLAQFEEIFNYQSTKSRKYRRQFTKEEKQAFAQQGIKIANLPKEQKYVKDPSIILVLEDMLANRSIFNKPIVRDLAIRGRHQNIFAILSCQYIRDLPPPIRQNIDYWALFACDDDTVRHGYYEMFFKAHFKTYALFAELFDAATQDHRILFVDARDSSNDPYKKFSWYRADANLPPFRIGCQRFWDFAKKNYKTPDAVNKVIVNKYASRMASTRDAITASELVEVAEREAIVETGGTNRKRKRTDAIATPIAKRPAVMLEDDGPEIVDVAIDDEEEFEELPVVAEVKRRRSSRSQVE